MTEMTQQKKTAVRRAFSTETNLFCFN